MTIAADEMPAKLAQCAFALFSRRGIGRVRMDDIAAAAGVTKGSLYWHYRSKCEVIHATCQQYYRNWQRQMDDETAGVTSAAQRLEKAIRLSVKTCLMDEGNRMFTLELFTLSLHDGEVREGWSSFFHGVREFYCGLLRGAIASGELQHSQPEAAVDVMLAAMEGYKLRALFEPELCHSGAGERISAELLTIVGIFAAS